MILLFLALSLLVHPAEAADRADTLAAKAQRLYEKHKPVPARKAAERSLSLRENADALGVLVLLDLDDASAPLPKDPGVARDEGERRSSALTASMARLEKLDPSRVELGIARTVIQVSTEGDLLEPQMAPCSATAQQHDLMAEQAFAAGNVAVALKEYDAALAGCPTASTWWTYSGDALKQQGDPRGAIDRYETAVTIDPCHHIAHRFLADTMAGLPDLRKEEIDLVARHALDAVVCNPHYEAGWSTLGAMLGQELRVRDLRLTDPAGYQFLVAQTAPGPEDPLDRRISAATAVLAAGAPDTPLWKVLAVANQAHVLPAAVAFETLDAEIADSYRARRLSLHDDLTAWVAATRLDLKD